MSSSANGLFPTTSSGLFPTPTASTSSGTSLGASANVYYLVFVGVLLVLLLLAACLAYRAYRIRRRFRTATQLAIMRGDPLPQDLREDYWGLGRLSGWTPQGLDRFGQVGLAGVIKDGQGKWKAIPVLYEAVIEENEKMGQDIGEIDFWERLQPVTVHSLRPPDEALSLYDDPPQAPSHSMGPRPRPPPVISLSTLAVRRRQGQEEQVQGEIPLDEGLDVGEEVRVAVVVSMPFQGERKRMRIVGEDNDEGTGWENGMELGVWEGVVSDGVRRRRGG